MQVKIREILAKKPNYNTDELNSDAANELDAVEQSLGWRIIKTALMEWLEEIEISLAEPCPGYSADQLMNYAGTQSELYLRRQIIINFLNLPTVLRTSAGQNKAETLTFDPYEKGVQ